MDKILHSLEVILKEKRSLRLALFIALIGFSFITTSPYAYHLSIRDPEGPRTSLSSRPILLSDDIVKLHKFEVASLTEMTPSEGILLPGRVQSDPSEIAVVTARVQGHLNKILVQEAEPVLKEQVLASIQSTEFIQAEASHLRIYNHFQVVSQQWKRSQELFKHEIISAKEYHLALTEFKSTKAEYFASQSLLKNLGLSDEELTQLESSMSKSSELSIRSPLDGVVIERNANLGQLVRAEETLFKIGNLNKVHIVLDVYEKDIAALRPGNEAEISFLGENSQERTIQAKVARISHTIDNTTRSGKVWLEVENRDHSLRIGQAVNARVVGSSTTQNGKLWVIPVEAIHKIEGKNYVFVQIQPNQYEAREVEIGWTSDRWIEIKSGVSPKDHVVTGESFILKSEFLRF